MKLFAAREEDVHQGWVWLKRANMPHRSTIKITNPQSGKHIFCEALQIDDNFLRGYNQSPRLHITPKDDALVISGWYRAGLDIRQSGEELPLEVTLHNSWIGQFRTCIGHPQIVVRQAAWLGAIGLALGIIGTGLGLLSFIPRG